MEMIYIFYSKHAIYNFLSKEYYSTRLSTRSRKWNSSNW